MQEKAIPVCFKSSKWARTPVWLNSELHGGQEEKETVISGSEVRHHRKSSELWFAYEERRFERPKTQLELRLVTAVSDNREGLFKVH